jgi:NADPH-dependent 2,4-dienoyl-CoA reductase/sulfur reductase-like enzyme
VAPKVLVLGSNFAGLTAALAVKHQLQDDVEVTVISKDDHFIFNPSFIWIPFGKRQPADITWWSPPGIGRTSPPSPGPARAARPCHHLPARGAGGRRRLETAPG